MPRTIRAVLVHAASDSRMGQVVGDLQEALAGMGCKVVVRPAAEARATDLAASDLVILGSAPQGGEAIHPDFSELLRTLRGMTLANRAVGVFSLGEESTLLEFRSALRDCEVLLPDSSFTKMADRSDAADTWLRPLVERAGASAGER